MNGSAPELEGRIVAHLEEIAEQTESFDRVTTRVGEEGFVAAWGRSGTAEQIDLKGSVERAYEQIVNDLRGPSLGTSCNMPMPRGPRRQPVGSGASCTRCAPLCSRWSRRSSPSRVTDDPGPVSGAGEVLCSFRTARG
jgi:hypothetical protein